MLASLPHDTAAGHSAVSPHCTPQRPLAFSQSFHRCSPTPAMTAIPALSRPPFFWRSVLMTLLMGIPIIGTHAFAVKDPVTTLLQNHATDVARLKVKAQSIVGGDQMSQMPYNNDVFFLRYCVGEKGIDDLAEALAWREGKGRAICEAAVQAVTKATSGEGVWDNAPIRDGAPNASKINPYITPTTTLTTSSSQGDLIYCIRAGLIDDSSLMASLGSVDELVDFFLYCKEVNALVANDRSLQQDKLLSVITVNDLDGLKLIGGDATFRQALSAASKQANKLYPALNGPTLLLNLPRLLSALVKLFTPLFPPEVQKRLKFERGPLQGVKELVDITYGGKDRDTFLKDVDSLCYP